MQPAVDQSLFQPGGVASTAPGPLFDGETLPPETASPCDPLSLEELVQLALTTNPALAQAEARVQALRGEWVQVGLPPNPTAGYVGGEIGNEGMGGQQGGFIGQQFITGGKLRLNRAILAQEIQQSEQRLAAMQMRVQTDVRQAFYANAHTRAKVYTAEILPKSQRTYELVQRGYQQEELGYLDVLSAQRTYSQANLAYLDALSALWTSWTEIDGLLLTGSLAAASR